MAPPVRQSSPRQRGRRIASGAYYALIVVIALPAAIQVSQQVLFGPSPRPPYPSCREGLRALFDAVVRARDAAAHTDEGEDAALARFRSALDPEWGFRDGVASTCRASKDEGTLDAIERLRYAEEHAVRHEAGELAPLRRRVQAIVDGELGSAPAGTGRR
jgi:hypothetical protein